MVAAVRLLMNHAGFAESTQHKLRMELASALLKEFPPVFRTFDA